MKLRIFMHLQALAFVCLVTGCAGSKVAQVDAPKALPQELGKDTSKYEVLEVSDSTAAPTTLASPVPEVHKRRKSKSQSKIRKSPKPIQPSDEAAADSVPEAGPIRFPNRRPAKDPIWVGEKMTYNITYFAVSAGDFTLESLALKMIDGRKVYSIRGKAVSSSVFSVFYRLNDTVETYIDYEGIFSHRLHVMLDETKQSRDSLELFDSEKAQSFWWDRWNHKDRGYAEKKEFAAMPRFTQDTLSGLYYLRTVPLRDGEVITFPITSESKFFDAVVTVIGHEKRDTVLGDVNTVKLRIQTKHQGVLKNEGENYLWLTDDDRRVLVRLEAKVKIGTVTARLTQFQPGTAPSP